MERITIEKSLLVSLCVGLLVSLLALAFLLGRESRPAQTSPPTVSQNAVQVEGANMSPSSTPVPAPPAPAVRAPEAAAVVVSAPLAPAAQV
ncbi:MAG: hypothetical protein FJX76_13650, partial [Armatimonadetes bacterium]|nr:hypothetical protein [Armatimonadota bacterium]